MAIVNITDHPSIVDWWQFTLDGWGWICKSIPFGKTPVRDDSTYNFPKNVSGELWNPSVWLISLPVALCLSELAFLGGYTVVDNSIIYSGTDVEDYYIHWIYNVNIGVVSEFNIQNSENSTVFKLSAPTSQSNGIPGYNLYIIAASGVLLINAVSIILIKKIKWKEG
ncbi:MAG: hypothetical protein ACFFEN_05240 [Candidatus Thorarchaeota archaeon]